MEPKLRLAGLDLFRGIAIFSVIVIHTDQGFSEPPWGHEVAVQFAGLAVPFFLAASFYLSIDKIITSPDQSFRLKPRLGRLLLPYIFWTVFYILYKLIKYGVDGDLVQIENIFSNLNALIFFGGAAIHLYFLPLLITGTVLTKLLEPFIKHQRKNRFLSLFLFILSLSLYEWLLSSGNDYLLLGNDIAFKEITNSLIPTLQISWPFKFITVGSAWVIRCLTYISCATVFVQFKVLKDILLKCSSIYFTALLIAFFLLNAFGHFLLPLSIHEISRGFLTLILAMAVSKYLPKNSPKLLNIGLSSFGIYLIHLFVLEGVQIITSRLFYDDYKSQVTTLALLAIAVATFLISWTISNLLMRSKPISKVSLGS